MLRMDGGVHEEDGELGEDVGLEQGDEALDDHDDVHRIWAALP